MLVLEGVNRHFTGEDELDLPYAAFHYRHLGDWSDPRREIGPMKMEEWKLCFEC